MELLFVYENQSHFPNFKANAIIKSLQRSSFRRSLNYPELKMMFNYIMMKKKEIDMTFGTRRKDLRKAIVMIQKLNDYYRKLCHRIFRNNLTVKQVSSVLECINSTEKKCENALEKILAETPDDPKVLRKFGKFLLVFKGDSERADAFFQYATEIESFSREKMESEASHTMIEVEESDDETDSNGEADSSFSSLPSNNSFSKLNTSEKEIRIRKLGNVPLKDNNYVPKLTPLSRIESIMSNMSRASKRTRGRRGGGVDSHVVNDEDDFSGKSSSIGARVRKRGKEVEEKKKWSVWSLKLFFLFFLVVIFASALLENIETILTTRRFSVGGNLINSAALERKLTVGVAHNTKKILESTKESTLLDSEKNTEYYVNQLEKNCNVLSEGINFLYFSHGVVWQEEVELEFVSDTGESFKQKFSYIDSMNEYVRRCRTIISEARTEGGNGIAKFEENLDYIFIQNNMERLLLAMMDIFDELLVNEQKEVSKMQTQVLISSPIFISAPPLLFFFILIWIKFDLYNSLRIFKIVPKESVIGLFKKFGGDEDEIRDNKIDSQSLVQLSYNTFGKVSLPFVIVFVMFAAGTIGLSTFAYIGGNNFHQRNLRVGLSGKTRMLTQKTHYLSTLLIMDGYEEELTMNLHSTILEIKTISESLRFGSDEYGLKKNQDETVLEYFNHDTCNDTAATPTKFEELDCLCLSKKYNLLYESAMHIIRKLENNKTVLSNDSFYENIIMFDNGALISTDGNYPICCYNL